MFLDQLQLGDNIAKNTALSENVFMMVVCIELRIPLFVVGKPGSSKSLAKTIIQDNMQGTLSHSDLFKEFKQVYLRDKCFTIFLIFQRKSFCRSKCFVPCCYDFGFLHLQSRNVLITSIFNQRPTYLK